jgi:hypothetical protein
VLATIMAKGDQRETDLVHFTVPPTAPDDFPASSPEIGDLVALRHAAAIFRAKGGLPRGYRRAIKFSAIEPLHALKRRLLSLRTQKASTSA